jgi:hypothetical protein
MLPLSIFGHPRLAAAPTLRVPAAIDAEPWDALLKKYVNDQGLVAYAEWKNDPADMKALDAFVNQYAGSAERAAKGREEIAALINAYNAFTVQWILRNYPTESIRDLDKSWDAARWTIGGRTVSLDEIEHKNLRPLYGWKVHATIVCAARSCPPLQREAFTPENLVALTDRAYSTWLGRADLNRFEDAHASISPIFKWFKEDFTGEGELAKVLARYAPEKYRAPLARGEMKIDYLEYDWGLNDQSDRGRNYHRGIFERLLGHAK